MIIHTHNNNHQCKFKTASAIIVEKETNWRRTRRIKKAIYSTLTNSINEHDEIDQMWLPIISNNAQPTKNKLKQTRQAATITIDLGTGQDDFGRMNKNK